MFDPVFFFRSVQRCGGEVTPAELGGKRVPKQQIELARAPAILITPLQNFLVGPALEHALGYDCVVQPEELAARAVSRVPLAEVLVIIGRQLVLAWSRILSSMRGKYIIPPTISLGLFGQRLIPHR